ncbi:MAG TPA: hypothetical protein VJQ59_17005 [Candidatus Sulfotelmatobacter sp.]|nr:hypothetical protein [Candidatus Sulfotelmatobacter sp.]
MITCGKCGQEIFIGSWPFCRSRTNPAGHDATFRHDAQINDKEAIVLYEHPTKGIRWPGRNDQQMPKAYAREGFQRVEYKNGLADVRRIEKRHNVVSEVGNYDRGSGSADRE